MLSIRTTGFSLGALFAVTYILCLAWDIVFPGWAMYQLWQQFLPGFDWNVTGILIGFVEIILYGFYIAVIFVPLYNYLNRHGTTT